MDVLRNADSADGRLRELNSDTRLGKPEKWTSLTMKFFSPQRLMVFDGED